MSASVAQESAERPGVEAAADRELHQPPARRRSLRAGCARGALDGSTKFPPRPRPEWNPTGVPRHTERS